MSLDNLRKRLDHRLDAFSGGEQPEGREQEPAVYGGIGATHIRPIRRCERRLELSGICGDDRGRSVRHDPHLLDRARAALYQQPSRCFGHDDHALCLTAQRGQHLRLMIRGLGQHRVQRHHERLRELLRQREHVFTVRTAENSVLMLKQDHVDVQPPQNPGCAGVICADGLHDRRDHPRPLRTRRLVDDHDLLDALDPVHREQCSANVGRERADPTRSRREGRNDRRAHSSRFPSWTFQPRRAS